MSRPTNTPAFWKQRFAKHPADPRRLLWDGSDEAWERMETDHRKVLEEEIKPDDKVLDAGCGYGRLLDLLPFSFRGTYVGVDISPDMIEQARVTHPDQKFIVGDLTALSTTILYPTFDIAICIMVRHMMLKDIGEQYWRQVEAQLARLAKRTLILEPREVL